METYPYPETIIFIRIIDVSMVLGKCFVRPIMFHHMLYLHYRTSQCINFHFCFSYKCGRDGFYRVLRIGQRWENISWPIVSILFNLLFIRLILSKGILCGVVNDELPLLHKTYFPQEPNLFLLILLEVGWHSSPFDTSPNNWTIIPITDNRWWWWWGCLWSNRWTENW